MPKRTPAKRKEPKSIEEARPLILGMVPNHCRVHIYAHWGESREDGRAWSSVGYDCTIYGPTGQLIIDVKAPTPAGLVAAVHRAFEELFVKARAAAEAQQSARRAVDVLAYAMIHEFGTATVTPALATAAPKLPAPGRPRIGGVS